MKPFDGRATLASVKNLAGACLVFTGACLAPPLAAAQEWPQRPVKFILPFGPGSSSDTAARLLADKLQTIWGKPVVVEPRPGGDSMISINAFVSANDDHTLFFGPSSVFVAHPHRYAKLSYNRERDMIPVAQMSTTTLGFAIPASLPVKTIKDFIAYAKANPGKVNVAAAPGASDMALDAFVRDEKLAVTKVPYRDIVQGANDVAAGRLQALFAAVTIFQGMMQAKTVRLISITGTKPSPAAPGVETAIAQGYPRLGQEGLMGIFAPPSMAASARNKLEADFLKVANEPTIAGRLGAIGQVHYPAKAQEFADNIKKQADAIAEVAKILGTKPQ